MAQYGFAPKLYGCHDIGYKGWKMVVMEDVSIYGNALEEHDLARLLLLDFDWAGRIGVARYPWNLNKDINWPEGVQSGGLIHPDHDKAMIHERYRNLSNDHAEGETPTESKEG
eukprot:gene14401-16540_t